MRRPLGTCTGPYAACSDGVCVACGGLDQPCCWSATGRYCGASFVCGGGPGGGRCLECGGEDQACCQAYTCEGGLDCGGFPPACR